MSNNQNNRSDLTLSRRGLLAATALLGVAATRARAASSVNSGEVPEIKALVFDIQGTVVDYYSPLVEIGNEVNQRNNISVDWGRLAPDWVSEVGKTVGGIVSGQQSWLPVGQIFRAALEEVLKRQGVAERLSIEDRTALLSTWVKMRPWPDSLPGITRLKQRYTVAALSNGSMAGVVRVSKNGGLPFDAILTGELAKTYKPSPDVYNLAVSYLGFPADQIMMVACHKWDLKGAKAAGLRTAFLPRPAENGGWTRLDTSPAPFIDVMASDLTDLATRLGA